MKGSDLSVITESLAIIFILLVMSYMFMRNGKVATAVSVLPLMIVPGAYLISGPIATVLAPWLSMMTVPEIRVVIVIIGLIITGIILGIISVQITQKVLRRGYLFLCGSFTIVITIIMMSRLLVS